MSLQTWSQCSRTRRAAKIPCLQAEFHNVSSPPLPGCLGLSGQRLVCAHPQIFLPHLTVKVSLSLLEERYQTCPKVSRGSYRPDPASPFALVQLLGALEARRAGGCGWEPCPQGAAGMGHTALPLACVSAKQDLGFLH